MKPQRIASLLASATEILYGLGVGDRVVAVSHECDFPAEANDKPRVTRTNVAHRASSSEIDREVRESTASGRALYEVDFPRLAELAPDLIVTQAQCDVCAVRYQDVLDAVDQWESLRGTEIVPLNPMTIADIFADIRRVGQATERQGEAEIYVNALLERVESVRQVGQAIPDADRPRAACLEWIDPPMLAANWTPGLIELAGGRYPPSTVAGQHSQVTAWEEIVDYDPQVLIIMPCGFDLKRTLAESTGLPRMPGWHETSAARAERVYAVDGNAYFNRSGPRIVDSLEILAHLIHPDHFAAPPCAEKPGSVWSFFDGD